MAINIRGLVPPVNAQMKVAVSCEIERIYNSCPDATYISSCLEFAEEFDYELDLIPKLISPTLRDRIEGEAINANLIKNKRNSFIQLDNWF